jgi:NAD(P)-dependent dehydrogenase (short-subunit alcohol dehydrogenase family)
MRVIVIGATGTIGRSVVEALIPRHRVVPVSYRQCQIRVDLGDPSSIVEMYRNVGKVDAVISTAAAARSAPLAELTDEDFALSLRNKLMGQVNLVRLGFPWLTDGGSFTLTSGALALRPRIGGVLKSLVNAGVEGFTRAVALEAPRGIRVNVVSPPLVAETLEARGMDPSVGTPVAAVAQAYVQSLEGMQNGTVLRP